MICVLDEFYYTFISNICWETHRTGDKKIYVKHHIGNIMLMAGNKSAQADVLGILPSTSLPNFSRTTRRATPTLQNLMLNC